MALRTLPLLSLPLVGLALAVCMPGHVPAGAGDPAAEQQAPAVRAAYGELSATLTRAQRARGAERAELMDSVFEQSGAFLDAHAGAATERQLALAANFWFQLAEERGEHAAMQQRIEALRALPALPEPVSTKLTTYAARLRTCVGQAAPAWRAPRIHGAGDASSADLTGRPVLLSFWATWNPHCRDLVNQRLSRLQARNPDLTLVHLGTPSNGETAARERAFFKTTACGGIKAFDASRECASTFGVDAVPVLVFVDAEGVIQARGPGWATIDAIERLLQAP